MLIFTVKWRFAGKASRLNVLRSFLMLICAVILVAGCNLIPTRPEAVFTLYRDRMKNGHLAESRQLLSSESLQLIDAIESKYKLQQTPEETALMNALDPGSAPVVMKVEDNVALLQVRTIKGALRVVKLVKMNNNGGWKIDLTEELRELENFLKGREALDLIRGQAGEYAASWKIFHDQIDRIKVQEPKAEITNKNEPVPQKPTVKPKPKKRVEQKKIGAQDRSERRK